MTTVLVTVGRDVILGRWVRHIMLDARLVFPPGVWESAWLEERELDFGRFYSLTFRARTDEGEPIVREEVADMPAYADRRATWEARLEAGHRISAWLALVLG